jgi:hypothetical protein
MTISTHERGETRWGSDLRKSARTLAIVFFCLLWGYPPRAGAQGDDDAEYRVKLAFLYNFAQFVQWPAEAFSGPTAPLVICVLGEDPFRGETEQSLRGRAASGHPIQIKKLKADDNPRACQIIFVRATEKTEARKILPALKGSSTLAVGEAKGFADLGGMINLVLDDNKLRFEINLDAAGQTRLKISSKLLSLAKIVKGDSGL